MTKMKALRMVCEFIYTNPEPEEDVLVSRCFNEETGEFEEWTYYGLLRFIDEERERLDKRGKGDWNRGPRKNKRNR